MDYDGIIFDKDGVLLDSRPKQPDWRRRFRREVLPREGLDMPVDRFNEATIRLEPDSYRAQLRSNGVDPEQMLAIKRWEQRRKRELIRAGDITLYPEVGPVLDAFRRRGVPMAVASNAGDRATRFVVDHHGLNGHFSYVSGVPTDDIDAYVRQAKPRTAMLDAAADAMGADNPVMIGDSPVDIWAAHNAGFDAVWVDRWNGTVDAEPEHRVADLRELPAAVGLFDGA